MKKGEIWIVDLPTTRGHEQMGTRPVIVWRELEANMVFIVPCTTSKSASQFPHIIRIKPSPQNNLDGNTFGLAFQFRAIDQKRLHTKIGTLEDAYIHVLEKMILGLVK